MKIDEESRDFKIEKADGICYLTVPQFTQTGLVRHFFTTRIGGVSQGSMSSMNLGFKTTDSREALEENCRRIQRTLGIDPRISIQLEHGAKVHYLNSKNCTAPIVTADSVITDEPNIPLTITYADCTPVYILDPQRKAIAMIHAGWRGTLLQNCIATMNTMVEKFHTDPKNCLAAIGPSIGQCCFEVDREIADKFQNAYNRIKDLNLLITNYENNKSRINLWELNKWQLIESGIPEQSISVANLCTACNDKLFYSHRRDKGDTGRMTASIMLL